MDVPGSRSRGRSKIFMEAIPRECKVSRCEDEKDPSGIEADDWLQQHLEDTPETGIKIVSVFFRDKCKILIRTLLFPECTFIFKSRVVHVECGHAHRLVLDHGSC